MNELYRDFIDGKADEIINSLGGTITPAPSNAELYRDFLERKFDDVINALNIKSFNYKGTGSAINTVTFPSKPQMILGIFGPFDNNNYGYIFPFAYGQVMGITTTIPFAIASGIGTRSINLTYNDNIITVEGANVYRALNINNETYTVYYI